MPANPIDIAQRVLLLQRFLNAVLADVGQSHVACRPDRVSPKSLGDRDDRHGLRRQSRNLGPHLR